MALGALVWCVSAAVAQPPEPPAGAIAWYHYDPSPPMTPGSSPARSAPDPMQRDLLLGAIRAGLSTGLFGDKTGAHAVQALLAGAELGNAPHTAALLEFEAHREPDGSGMDIDTLRAIVVLDVRDRAALPALLRSIRALGVATSGADAGALEQRSLALPGGKSGVLLTSRRWPPWMALAWTATETRFTLGIGRGALEHWMTPRADGAARPAWSAHRDEVTRFRPPSDTFLELYADVEGLRRAFPDAFRSGRTPRMMGSLELEDASSVMLHARFVRPDVSAEAVGATRPPMIALDWTAATQDMVQRLPISVSRWPGDSVVGMTPPPGSSVMVVRVDWRGLFRRALDVYEATVPDADLEAYRASRARWLASHAEPLERLLSSLRPWLVLSDVPAPILPIPGLATVFVGTTGASEAAGEPSAVALESLLGDLLASFGDELYASGPAGRRVWALKLDRRGVVRLPAWGFIETGDSPLLVGGWGLPVLTENRARLGPATPKPSPEPSSEPGP